jgi:trimethylamine:corrinoid methyltransferase-like protein
MQLKSFKYCHQLIIITKVIKMRTGIPVPSRFSPPIATREELMTIHEAAMYLLEKVGLGGVTPELCKVYKDLGCIVDEAKGVVKIPESLAVEAINAIPSTFILPARDPKNDCLMQAGSGRTLVGGFGLFSLFAKWNPETRRFEFRDATEEDNWKYQKIVEYFPEYDMTCPLYLPMDVAEAGYPCDIHDLNTTLQTNTKHVWHIDAVENVEYYARLAAEILGGPEELKKRPIITNHGDTPGLVLGLKTSGRMTGTLDVWEKGMPLLIDFTDVCIPGFQGPCSITGAYAVTVAASTGMAVALALGKNGIAKGKIPNMTYDLVMPLNAYTQVSAVGSAAFWKALCLHVNFWHRTYSRPKATMWPGVGMCTASDTQGGFGFVPLYLAMLNASDQCGVWQTTVGPQGIWLEGYAIFAELIHQVEHFVRDFDFSPGAFMFDKWLEKSPRGDFSRDKETLEKMTEVDFHPQKHGYNLWETRPYLRWIEDKLTIDDRAHALINKIVETFPAPLPPKDVSERMNAIVAEADKKLKI